MKNRDMVDAMTDEEKEAYFCGPACCGTCQWAEFCTPENKLKENCLPAVEKWLEQEIEEV